MFAKLDFIYLIYIKERNLILSKFTLPAFAKINIFLRVVGKRADGLHEICTVFQTVSLADFLTFSPRHDREICLNCNDAAMPTDEKNLVVKAALRLRERFGVEKGANIFLEKRIPSPGGLGGGSSDAAIALLGLAKLWKIQANKQDLCEIGKTLGADVPFFLTGGTAFGEGSGTEISPLADLREKYLLLVTPNESVPTAEAYKSLNAPVLTNESEDFILTICRDEANSSDLLQNRLTNDFESAIFRLKPEIARAKTKILAMGAINALMSGSGASVWGKFDNESARRNAFQNLQNDEKDWQVFEIETITKSVYAEKLALVENFLDASK